jgi:hypothetical protein
LKISQYKIFFEEKLLKDLGYKPISILAFENF